ncbi:NAD(P)/FAD-dependent oxidoreductase [Methanonatronarchaeum sp. AMET6-2]|uniref:geranylgeranyl reductase family protein n=1 Tax=Methanonatronarchaeum sp. AMET6-2 TaxID=2933293 RepID=UPI0012008FED|nr:NAD(P)/FAD-dependent oxidoreductase [Methanonatronarchaeum sp. AMET6-2]RZN61428.1 MAG: NAD(P)/FAD-dependent oxidoreductase [Methanonatronarchaeia archaeon]UOY09613.1 NAD(P)/FAD-dependent oxidoreductase [Methanonatronarchaeum sp. AMET6-2]
MDCDVLVVGGGPAGASAARFASEFGLDTLLVEKRQEIGAPVRCAEGVGKGVEEFIDVDSRFLSKEVVGARIYSPEGRYVEMSDEDAGDEVGYILERKVFDRELVKMAGRAGAETMLRTRASEMTWQDGFVETRLVRNGETKTVRSKIVIGADGVESKVGRWAGIDTSLKLNDIQSCAQYLVTGIDSIDMDYTHFYVGNDVAPGGYAWIFPKGDDKANVGLGVSPAITDKKAIEHLDSFVDSHPALEGGRVIEEVYGGVPVSAPLKQVTADNTMLVGDAARQVNPITGGGILNGLEAGKYAAETARNAIETEDLTKSGLKQYEEARQPIARENQRNYEFKEIFQDLDDEQFNSLISSLDGVNIDELSVAGLISKIVLKNPWIKGQLKDILKLP